MLPVRVCLLLAIGFCLNCADASTAPGFDSLWGYTGKIGPDTDHWPKLCHTGIHQSPINIDLANTVESHFSPLQFFNYDYKGDITMTNNGHSIAASGFESWGKNGSHQPYILGAGLDGKYNLIGFHFHWGYHDDTGSEHTLDTRHFPLEAHFVHQKAHLSAEEANEKSDGLAVVAVWFQVDNKNGRPLKELEKAYTKTDGFDQTFNVSKVHLSRMIPTETESFFRYEGSLTTPNCSEVVVWTILSEPMTVTDKQLLQLRKHSSTLGHLLHNFRDVQGLNGRTVFENKRFNVGLGDLDSNSQEDKED